MYRLKPAALIGPLCTSAYCDSANPAGAGTTFAPSPPLPGVPLTGLLPGVVLAEGVAVLVALELGGLVAGAAAPGTALLTWKLPVTWSQACRTCAAIPVVYWQFTKYSVVPLKAQGWRHF